MGHVVNLIFWPPKTWMNLDLQAPSPKSGLFGDGASSVWLHRGERRLGRCLHKCDVWNLVFLQTPLKVEGYSCLLMPTDGDILKHMCCSWWEMSGRSPWKALFQFDFAGTFQASFKIGRFSLSQQQTLSADAKLIPSYQQCVGSLT